MTASALLPRLEFRTILITIGSLMLALAAISYIVFQARFLIAGPQINLVHEAPILQNNRVVTLEGTAVNITHLWLNDRPIFTNEVGNFKEALVLENGYTIATLRAKDRYGRETRVVRPYVYTPASFNK
jgi:hypothetical protein